MTTLPALNVPQAPDAERALLGGILRDPRTLTDVLAVMQPADCFLYRHQAILEAMAQAAARGETPDMLNVADALRADGKLEAVGGYAYLAELTGATADTRETETYARRVARAAYRRRLLQAADTIRRLALAGASDEAALRAGIEQALADADGLLAADDPTAMRDLMSAYLDHMEATADLGAGITGLATGFADYDALLDGLQPGSLNYVAGRPGMGKSALVIGMALNVAKRLAAERPDAPLGERGGVYVWSGEMSRLQLRERMLASETGIANTQLRRGLRPGGLTPAQYSAFVAVTGALAELPLYLDDAFKMTPALLEARVKRAARRRGGLDLIIVDYIGLLEPGVKKQDRNNEMGYLSRKLKQLADVAPVVCAAQLSRGVEQRQDKRPVMSDLRDSGNLEQDADTVTFIYRDVVYNPTTPVPDVAEWIVAKNRHGGTGTISMIFDRAYTRYRNGRA